MRNVRKILYILLSKRYISQSKLTEAGVGYIMLRFQKGKNRKVSKNPIGRNDLQKKKKKAKETEVLISLFPLHSDIVQISCRTACELLGTD